jgi:hypothetical protein
MIHKADKNQTQNNKKNNAKTKEKQLPKTNENEFL